MTIIIKHLDTGNEYILLSAGWGTAKSSLPSRVLNDLFTSDHPDKTMMIAACDVQGRIVWLKSNDVIVTEIDGKKPFEILPEIIPASFQPLLDSPDIDSDIEGEEKNLNEDFDEDEEEWV